MPVFGESLLGKNVGEESGRRMRSRRGALRG